MAVREHWEIKGIQWIAVQEDWVTVVSQADTVNFVWWWTVTDVWGVATINIPQWATWYREDVPMGSATYTFVNSPATATSFLIFTDSGTLLFSWIDYTYDPDTETVTFLSLWANERAYIWVAHALVNGGNVWDMVKAVYDPNNVQQNVYDYNYFINTPTIPDAQIQSDWAQADNTKVDYIKNKPTINIKAFYLASTSDLTNAQAAYDWLTSGNIPVVVHNDEEYFVASIDSSKVILCGIASDNSNGSSYTERTQDNLIFSLSGGTVTGITTGFGGNMSMYYLSPWVDYATPYTPQYDGSPATKKYVDDSVADMVEWPASSVDWNIVVFDGNTGKVIKDSGLNIQVSNNPSGNPCNIFYDNGTIYLQVVVPSNILLENDDNLITEDDKNIILEN